METSVYLAGDPWKATITLRAPAADGTVLEISIPAVAFASAAHHAACETEDMQTAVDAFEWVVARFGSAYQAMNDATAPAHLASLSSFTLKAPIRKWWQFWK